MLYNVKAHFKIKRAKDFITVFEKLLKTGFDIEIVLAPERSGLGQYVCAATFKSSQLLEASEDKAIAFAEYLAMTSQLEDLGIEIERQIVRDLYVSPAFNILLGNCSSLHAFG